MYIKSFGSVSEITMVSSHIVELILDTTFQDYKAGVYLKLGWVDPRLDHPNITEVLHI